MSDPTLDPRRQAWVNRARVAGLVLVAIAVAAVVPQLLVREDEEPASSTGGTVEAQQVVTWALHEEGGETYIAVFASGGRDPVVLAIPAGVTVNLPGQNLGTLADAAAAADAELLEVAVENLLGTPVDRTVLAPLSTVGVTIEQLGEIEVRGRAMSGAAVAQYLSAIPPDAPLDLAFLRWQDVLEALIQRAPDAGSAPDPLGMIEDTDTPLRALPVIDIGGGLLRPDQQNLAALVEAHFVRSAREEVRLVVLNGVGEPGIGKEVARILIPEGFRLVSSGNANTFDLEVTQIIASSRADLDAAERALTLLGAGEISVGNQPAGLADVTVVVGEDFGGS